MIIELDYELITKVNKKMGWECKQWKSLVECDHCGKQRIVDKSSVIKHVGEKFCQPCSASFSAKNNLSTKPEEYMEFQKTSGFILLENIPENGYKKVTWRCRLGHITLNSLNGLKAGHKCNFCSKRRKRTEIDYQELARKFNIIYIGPLPPNIRTTTEWLCHCGNSIHTSYGNVLKGRFCYICGLKKITGPNHVMYNPLLTKEDRDRQRIYFSQINQWRKQVFKNYDYSCQNCSKLGHDLQGHHIFSWDSYPTLRFTVENGICLCKTCHKSFHSKYGTGKNDLDQLEEFLGIKLNLCSSLY